MNVLQSLKNWLTPFRRNDKNGREMGPSGWMAGWINGWVNESTCKRGEGWGMDRARGWYRRGIERPVEQIYNQWTELNRNIRLHTHYPLLLSQTHTCKWLHEESIVFITALNVKWQIAMPTCMTGHPIIVNSIELVNRHVGVDVVAIQHNFFGSLRELWSIVVGIHHCYTDLISEKKWEQIQKQI